jgi:hypothetical protein
LWKVGSGHGCTMAGESHLPLVPMSPGAVRSHRPHRHRVITRGTNCPRARCGTPRSPWCWTPVPRCAACSTTPGTRTPAPPAATTHSRGSLDRSDSYGGLKKLLCVGAPS